MEDLLERLEAAELLIAFATVCRKVYSRYAAQVFNYGLTDRPGPRFRMIIKLLLFPVYFHRVLRYVYANYGRRWNRTANEIIFRVTFGQMSREHARYCCDDASQLLCDNRSISSPGNAVITNKADARR